MESFFTVPCTASQNVISIWYSRLEPGSGYEGASAGAAPPAEVLAEKIAKAGAAPPPPAAQNQIRRNRNSRCRRPPDLRSACSSRRFKTELVIHLPLFGVGEDVVRFLDLLEFFLRRFVARIKVRMIFPGKLPVGLADFLLRRLAGDSEQFVIILFCYGGHES